MSYIWMILKGMLMGIANIIPGVSGGTMAVSLGIYDDLIYSITHLAKNWKKSMRILLPLGVGLVLGIIGFSYLIEVLLSQYTLPTALAFIGLILGGIPILTKSFLLALRQDKKNISFSHIALFLVFFALVVGLALIQAEGNTMSTITLSFGSIIKMFFVGVIASATMVVPGVSGSLVLMVLGYYYGILNSVTGFFSALTSMNIEQLLHYTGILFPFGIGVVAGIFLISKLIEYLFKNQPALTYSGILGLVLASPFAILYNTNALADLQSSNAVLFLILGLLFAGLCFLLTYYLGKTEDPA